ncbi:GAF domain-containing sensor histidine kinase [Candidatus Uhrbacteria bacterium]|nr:GAF domain-containing sensor histidine kinase [Candidatus Uhrbacteria bacterium]
MSQNTFEIILRVLFCLLVSFFGYLLIKSVRNEVKRREETQELSDKLKLINEELEQRNLFLNALQDITSLITKTLDFKEMAQDIVDGIATRLNYVGGILLLLSEDLKKLHVMAYTKTKLTEKATALLPQDPHKYAGDFEHSNSLAVMAIKEGQIQVADQLDRFVSPTLSPLVAKSMQFALGVKSVVAVPIFSESSIIGSLLFMVAKPKDKIQKTEFQTMQALANQMGIVARNLMFYEEIRVANDNLAVANEKLKELDKTKSEFISIASHQLRTPLTIIKGYISLIQEGQYGKISNPVAETLVKIMESGQRLIDLVNDLLDISRIESGRMVFELKPTDINALVKNVVEELKVTAEKKNLKFTYEAPDKAVVAAADPGKLRQVIVNLIDNAIKYTNHGVVKVGLKASKGQVIFEVSDSGVGIPPEDMSRLFQKFARGSLTLTSVGTGLGLFVGKKIIEAHHGQIACESKGKDKGSKFYFVLTESKEAPVSPTSFAPGVGNLDKLKAPTPVVK